MKLLIAPTLFSALLLGACSNTPEASEPAVQPAQPAVSESAGSAATASHANPTDLSGKVLETMKSGGYTYVLLDTDKGQAWAAGLAPMPAVGSHVTISGLTPMSGFSSKTLGRTFDKIYFCDAMQVTGPQADSVDVVQETTAPVEMQKAEGGQTVEQIFLEKDKFVGKQVALHGKVVKFSAAIMGKNWIHLQDGTGSKGTDDLTITTDQTVKVGDTVQVSGVLVADKDFGYGYKYALIVEDAEVTVD